MLGSDEAAVLERAGGACIAVDDGGLIQYASPAALALTGHGHLVGEPLVTIIPARLRPQHEAGFARYLREGRSRLQGHTVRVPALREDGRETEVDLTIRVFRRPDRSLLAVALLVPAATGQAPPGLLRIESEFTRRAYRLI